MPPAGRRETSCLAGRTHSLPAAFLFSPSILARRSGVYQHAEARPRRLGTRRRTFAPRRPAAASSHSAADQSSRLPRCRCAAPSFSSNCPKIRPQLPPRNRQCVKRAGLAWRMRHPARRKIGDLEVWAARSPALYSTSNLLVHGRRSPSPPRRGGGADAWRGKDPARVVGHAAPAPTPYF